MLKYYNIHANPPQEIPQEFRKFRWAFHAYPLRVDPQRPQICGGVLCGIFICSAGHRRGKRNEGDTEERGEWRDNAESGGTLAEQKKAEESGTKESQKKEGNGGTIPSVAERRKNRGAEAMNGGDLWHFAK